MTDLIYVSSKSSFVRSLLPWDILLTVKLVSYILNMYFCATCLTARLWLSCFPSNLILVRGSKEKKKLPPVTAVSQQRKCYLFIVPFFLKHFFSPKKEEGDLRWVHGSILPAWVHPRKKQTKRHAFLVKGQSGLFLLPVDPSSHSGIKKTTNTLSWVTHQALKGD